MPDKNKNQSTAGDLEEIDFDLDNLDNLTGQSAPPASQPADDQPATAGREAGIESEEGFLPASQPQPEAKADDAQPQPPTAAGKTMPKEAAGDQLTNEDETASSRVVPTANSGENGGNEEEKALVLPFGKAKIIKQLLANIRENSRQLENLLAGLDIQEDSRIRLSQIQETEAEAQAAGQERIIEGVFDGEKMIGPDGKQYTVPANYASKSKLVEGDMMKLTITANGTFLYKQIGPVERKRLVGVLAKDANGNYVAVVDGRQWRVLTASVTYFRGQVGDEIVILVPRAGGSRWAAVENIVKKS